MKIKLKRTFITGESGSFLLKSLLFFACFFVAGTISIYAQTKTITGVVTDVAKEPLIGVSVRVQGTTTGDVTDLDGKYSISANVGDVLDFTYVGMKSQSVKVGSQNTINIVMEDDAKLLNETVVIGYGTAKKRDLTGSIITVNAKEFADRPSANPLASLQGRIAGVQIINTGRPGQDPEIRMRGTNSLNGYAPLYVVDGLLSDNINYLNPSDIESMEILKDPSSLAIFGLRGANGVIIITTKRAKEGQTVVNINSSIGWKRVNDRIALTNAAQFKELYNEQLSNMNQPLYDYSAWTADTNWQDEIFQTGFITNNNISITGASEKNRFYLGVGYTSEDGSIKSEKYSKVTINLNSDYNVKEWLRFGFTVNGARTLPPDAKGAGSAVKAAPIAPVYGRYKDPITEETETLLHTLPGFQRAQVWNPMIAVELQGDHNKATNYRVAGSVYGEADLMTGLKFKATYSLDYATSDSRSYSPTIHVYNPDIPGKELISEFQSINQSKSHNLTAQQDYILSYDRKFGLHGLNATAGITTNYREYSSLGAGRSQKYGTYDLSIPDNNPDKWWITSIGDSNSATNSGAQNRRFTMAYLLRALYNYNNRYLFNASYRRDGSSVFRNKGNTWDNFGSVGAGWIMSEESFMANQSVIDYLKIKASWGILGTENTGGRNYPSYPGLQNTGSAIFNGVPIPSYSNQYRVQNIGWEKTHSWEVGFEMLLLDNRLKFDPVYYSKQTRNILLMTPSKTGLVDELQNLAVVDNKGVELSASWSDRISGSDFNYSLGANLTTIDNKIKKLDENPGTAILDGVSRTIQGMPIAYFYGYKVIGVYQNEEHIKQMPKNTMYSVKPGDLIFEDIDGSGEITDKDRTMIGNPTPDFTYGFNVNLSYKQFDLSVDMMGVYGNEVYRNWDTSEYAQFNYISARMDRWHGEGTSNWEPILDPGRAVNRAASSYFIEDGSYFRIRNIQLGYTFESSFLKKLQLTSLRVYTNIQNLKTWSKNTGYTPEIGGNALSFGVDNGTYPMPAIYTFGVNLTF